MSFRGHVSSNTGGRSEIKNLINELITEIEREHGLDEFPERYNEIDENLDFESKKSLKKGPVFQNLLEDRMKRVELILASFQRQEIQSRAIYLLHYACPSMLLCGQHEEPNRSQN